MDRNDYEKRKGPKSHPPVPWDGHAVFAEFTCVLSVQRDKDKPATHAAIRLQVDFIRPPIICQIASADDMDKIIDTLISARNYVWPNN